MMTNTDLDLRALPQGLRRIVKHLGVEKTIAVLTEQQGQMFYIPEKLSDGHEVVKVFGKPLAQELIEANVGPSYQIPMLHKVLMQIRNQQICQALDAKTSSIQQLVERFKITRQHITSIYSAHQLDAKHETQLDLSL